LGDQEDTIWPIRFSSPDWLIVQFVGIKDSPPSPLQEMYSPEKDVEPITPDTSHLYKAVAYTSAPSIYPRLISEASVFVRDCDPL
jgi:hypothetical protein